MKTWWPSYRKRAIRWRAAPSPSTERCSTFTRPGNEKSGRIRLWSRDTLEFSRDVLAEVGWGVVWSAQAWFWVVDGGRPTRLHTRAPCTLYGRYQRKAD